MQGGHNFAFIDSQNLNKSIEKQGWTLDYQRFRIYLKEKYDIQEAFLFFGYLKNHQATYHSLKKWGYKIIFKPVVFGPNGKPKGNIDGELILHTMIQYTNFNKAVIVSGDGDFYCLIEYLKSQDKLAYIIIPSAHEYSKLLRPFMQDHGLYMRDLRGKVEYEKSSN
jgi:uncharacterized LabA/DUF88 family protein